MENNFITIMSRGTPSSRQRSAAVYKYFEDPVQCRDDPEIYKYVCKICKSKNNDDENERSTRATLGTTTYLLKHLRIKSPLHQQAYSELSDNRNNLDSDIDSPLATRAFKRLRFDSPSSQPLITQAVTVAAKYSQQSILQKERYFINHRSNLVLISLSN